MTQSRNSVILFLLPVCWVLPKKEKKNSLFRFGGLCFHIIFLLNKVEYMQIIPSGDQNVF